MIHNWNGKWRSNGDSPRAVDLADLSASHLQSINFHNINLCASMRELIVYLRIKLFPRVKSFHRFFFFHREKVFHRTRKCLSRPSGRHPTALLSRFHLFFFVRPCVRCSHKLLSIVRKFVSFTREKRSFRARRFSSREKAISCQKAINFPRVLLCENRQLIWKQTINFIYFIRTDGWFVSVDFMAALMVSWWHIKGPQLIAGKLCESFEKSLKLSTGLWEQINPRYLWNKLTLDSSSIVAHNLAITGA